MINVLYLSHQKKKKKERRKGRDAAEEEEDDLLTLTRLSLQASDEEGDPGGPRSRRVQVSLLQALVGRQCASCLHSGSCQQSPEKGWIVLQA